MKYVLVFISEGQDVGTVFGHNIPPGSMYEVSRFATIEEASDFAKSLYARGEFIILPFYECK